MNVSFYVIQLPLFTPSDGRLVPRPAAKGFRDLAEKTGGRYFVAGTSASALIPDAKVDLMPVFAAIEGNRDKPLLNHRQDQRYVLKMKRRLGRD